MSLILRAHVATAAQDVVPSWPVESFIAVNPLAGHESYSFDSVAIPGVRLTRLREQYLADLHRGRITDADLEAALRERVPELEGTVTIGARSVPAARVAIVDMTTSQWSAPPDAEQCIPWLDDYLATWVALYVNPDPLWAMPHRQHGFFGAWRTLARRDPTLPRSTRRGLAAVSPQPDVALAEALARLGVNPKAITEVLRQELRYLSGWVGHIKWRAEKIGDIDLVSYLAVRFTLRALQGIPLPPATPDASGLDESAAILWQRAEQVATVIAGPDASRDDMAAVARVISGHPIAGHPFTWQKAYELHYRRTLLPAIDAASDAASDRPRLQVMMCIDPRSEGMRRHLESDSDSDSGVETFGFAGFFGVPVRFARYLARGAVDSLPALLSARHRITEDPSSPDLARKSVADARGRDAFRRANHVSDSSTTTPFALAEATGWIHGAMSIIRTLTPTLHARLHRALVPSPLSSSVTVGEAFTLDERVAMAETAIRMMGISRIAPMVVLAGHASESANNLYQSALDCGACGGNPGAANARAAAAIFNDPDVRERLRARGIDVPADSFFVAAEHNTVSDAVGLLDRHLIPASHAQLSEQFDRLQRSAADALVTERAGDLPGASSRHRPSRTRGRAYDWAEVYPELGLAGNSAMIIGPRAMTRGVDLGRRVFLHSYETALDPDGTALETIMTAPLVVAQWINHQYYFSALNPATLGAGTKTIHNAIGTIGVLSGQSGDLRRGLPWQSVGVGSELFHEPMRLTVVVQAPLKRVGEIVSRNQVLRNLLDNDWITLTARDDGTADWHRYTRYGWTTTTPTNPTTEGS